MRAKQVCGKCGALIELDRANFDVCLCARCAQDNPEDPIFHPTPGREILDATLAAPPEFDMGNAVPTKSAGHYLGRCLKCGSEFYIDEEHVCLPPYKLLHRGTKAVPPEQGE